MHEIEEAVLAGVGAGDEGGPGDGALRGCGGGEAGETALVAQAFQVGEFVDVALDEAGVHAIDSEDYDGFRFPMAAAGEEEKQEKVVLALTHRLAVVQPFTVSQGWGGGSWLREGEGGGQPSASRPDRRDKITVLVIAMVC